MVHKKNNNCLYKLLLILLILVYTKATAKITKKNTTSIRIPRKIYFADQKIYMCKEVRNRIKKKIESIRRWRFQEMIDKANLFFPIMDVVMKSHDIHSDIRYLAMHESGLKIDCISETKDVGIWQIHPSAISEIGLYVDNNIDERMHLIYSTLAMCKKMKINYGYFDNWIDTILAYNMGKKGTIDFVKSYGDSYIRQLRGKSLYLGPNTPNYIIYVLAFKLAFEGFVGNEPHPMYKLHIHEISESDNFDQLTRKFNISKKLLLYYNKWLLNSNCNIPSNKRYHAIIPLKHDSKKKSIIKCSKQSLNHYGIFHNQLIKIRKLQILQRFALNSFKKPIFFKARFREAGNSMFKNVITFPIIEEKKSKNKINTFINGLKGIIIDKEQNISSVIKNKSISLKDFLKYNEIKINHKIKSGEIYYLEPKGKKAYTKIHIVKKGESWWSISQIYGINKNDLLLRNNRSIEIPKNKISVGRVLYLNVIRPKYTPIEHLN